MPGDSDYILGTDTAETERLHFQHQAWVREAYALWELGGLDPGHTVLDLGCGPGFTSFDLAHVVGRTGRVIARDSSARFLEFLAAERGTRGLPQIEPSLGPVEELELPAGSVDAAYARWLFCWLLDPGLALERVTRSLKPGGVVLLQEYLDWAAMKLVPRGPAHDRAVAACMQSWTVDGPPIDFAERVPELARACGLEVEHFRPIARLGAVGSLEWRWLGGFFGNYLPKLVTRGLLSEAELEAFRAEWQARTDEGRSWCYAPTMVDVVLRKPRE